MRGKDDFEGFYLDSYPRLVGQLTVVTGSLEDAVQEAFARTSVRWGGCGATTPRRRGSAGSRSTWPPAG